nr:hypothetical protein [Tanacetum cinerariifolium]
MKTKSLKEQAKVEKPVEALTVYPPNTPVKLVLRTCKKRITPTGLIEGERGFKQTKECYLTEVIPFFKTLKEHFKGIQKALTIEIKEMKTIFDELEAEVDQNAMNRKYDEIKRKNLLIANDTLIASCLYKEVFYIATNSELNESRFFKMHDAHTIVQARCLKLKTELSKLKDKIQKDDHDVMITQLTEKVLVLQEQNELFKVENAKVKQHYKELYDSIKITRAEHIDQTTALLTKKENLKVQINAKMKCVTIDSVTPKVLAPYFNKRDEKQATTPLNKKKQVTFVDQCETSNTNRQKHVEEQITQKTNVLVLPSTGVDSCTDASGSKPKRNTKKNRISPAKSINKKTVEDHSRNNKSHLQKPNRVDSSISSKRTVINSNSDFVCKTCNNCFISANHDMCVIKYLDYVNASSSTKTVVVQIVLWYLDSGCSKHITWDRSWLRNFVKKFNGTVRFGNDHFGAIMGEKLLLLLVISKTVPSFTLVITKPHMIWTRSYIFDALTDKYRARTKSGSCNTLCTPTNKDMEILFQPMFDEYLELPRVDRPVSPTPAVPILINSAGSPTAIDQDAPSPSHSPSSSAL